MKTRRHHKKPDEPKVKQLIDAHRARAHKHVPDRGTEQDGEVWEGFGPDKLKFQGITQAEQADNSTNSRVLAPNTVTDDHVSSRLTKINVAGLSDNRDSDAGQAVDRKTFGDFKQGLPNFSNFASADRVSNLANDVANKTNQSDVKRIIKNMVDKKSLR